MNNPIKSSKILIALCTLVFIGWAALETVFNIAPLQAWAFYLMPIIGLLTALGMVVSMLLLARHEARVTPIFKHGMIALMGACSAALMVMGSGVGNRFAFIFPLSAMFAAIGLLRVIKPMHKMTQVAPPVLSTVVALPVTLMAGIFFFALALGIDAQIDQVAKVASPDGQSQVAFYSVDQGALGVDFAAYVEKDYLNLFTLKRQMGIFSQPLDLKWTDSSHITIGSDTYTAPWLP